MRVIQQDLMPFQKEYLEKGCVKLPPFLNSNITNILTKSFSHESEKRFLLNGASTEYSFMDAVITTRLHVIFNDPEFIQGMSELIGQKISLTKQRLYYIDSNCVSLPWHDDSYGKDSRIAAMRFELSDAPYEGGDFHFRNESGESVFSHLQFGESVLFKIEFGKAEHMVTSVTSGKRKSLSMFLLTDP